MQKSRPSAVRIVTILAIANGIILLVGGVVTIYLVPTIITSELNKISNLTDASQPNLVASSTLTSAIISAVYTIASISISLGLAWFGLAWALFTSKSRTWLLTVILAIITLVFSIISIGNIVNITTLIISGVILYYMYRPQVKSYFGRVTTSK